MISVEGLDREISVIKYPSSLGHSACTSVRTIFCFWKVFLFYLEEQLVIKMFRTPYQPFKYLNVRGRGGGCRM